MDMYMDTAIVGNQMEKNMDSSDLTMIENQMEEKMEMDN